MSKSSSLGQNDVIEKRGRHAARLPTFVRADGHFESHSRRRRTSGTIDSLKDRALEEVLRKPEDIASSTHKTRRDGDEDGKPTITAVDQWMRGIDATSPGEQSRSVLEQLENRSRRPNLLRSKTTPNFFSIGQMVSRSPQRASRPREPLRNIEADTDLIDFGADDELVTTTAEEDNRQSTLGDHQSDKENRLPADEDDTPPHLTFQTPPEPRSSTSTVSAHALKPSPWVNFSPSQAKRRHYKHPGHHRDSSLQTIIFKGDDSSTSDPPMSPTPTNRPTLSRPATAIQTPQSQSRPGSSSNRPTRVTRLAHARPASPRHHVLAQPRHTLTNKSAPNLHNLHDAGLRTRVPRRCPSRFSDLASDIGDNRHNELATGRAAGFPASYQTNLLAEVMERRRTPAAAGDDETDAGGGEGAMVARVLLARMDQMEKSFREVLRDVKAGNPGSMDKGNSAAGREGQAYGLGPAAQNDRGGMWGHGGRMRDQSEQSEFPPSSSV